MRRPFSLLLTFALVPLLAGACSTFGTDPEASGPTPEADAAAAPDTADPVEGTADRGLTITVGDPKATAFVIQNGSLDLPIKLTRRESTTGAVLVTVKGLPPEVTAESVTIPAGKTEGTLTLLAKATSVQGGPKIADITATEQGPLGTGASAKLSTFVRGARGGLDTTFGDKGAVRMYGLGSEANAFDAKTLKNGSILVAARVRNNLVVSRFSSSGVIDSSFAGGGTLILLTSQGFPAFDVVEPASPATGWIYFLQAYVSSAPLIVRLNLDGVRDMKFNGNGEVALSDPGAAGSSLIPEQILALADGRALISHQRAGTTTTFVSRWNPDGTRDGTYGTSGTCAVAGYGRMLLRAGGAVFLTGGAGMRGGTANGLRDQSIGVAPDYTAVVGGGEAVDIARTPSGALHS